MMFYFFFFFNDTATTEIYTLSLHDALPISFMDDIIVAGISAERVGVQFTNGVSKPDCASVCETWLAAATTRSEEHTSELQSRQYLVCRLLLEKKKKQTLQATPTSYLQVLDY